MPGEEAELKGSGCCLMGTGMDNSSHPFKYWKMMPDDKIGLKTGFVH